MRYRPDEQRYDDQLGMKEHEQRYYGGKALVILGGYSAKEWQALRDEIKPDVILIANGVNSIVHGADYWVCAENLTRSHRMAYQGDADSQKIVEMFHREAGAKTRLVSHRSIDRLKDRQNAISIRRQGYELNEIGAWFSFREYGLGLLAGWELQHKEAGAVVHVGTVGAQLLHLAGILGCDEVHTIGYDLMFRSDEHHHAYDYPNYKVDKFRTDKYRVNYKGVDTQWTWIETAQWLRAIEWVFERDGLKWFDHSVGLLKLEGLKSAA